MANSNNDKSDDVRMTYLGICRELNMDKGTEKLSWAAYEKISKNFTLEGDPKHWFCCALYTGCRESITPVVGNASSLVKGNCVSLTKLLRCCQISIHDFFTKIKMWIDFTSTPHFSNQIERLERSFRVSYFLFQKYFDIFEKVFLRSTSEKKNKKSKPVKCSSTKLFEFCWCLFLCAKGEDPKHTVDIVTLLPLLLCCVDLIYLNTLEEKRDDIINPTFTEKSKSLTTSTQTTPTCILKILCEMFDAQYVEAKEIKQYSFKNSIENFFRTKTLQGDSENCMGIISNSNFERNLKSLNNSYEQYVLSVGDFDERMFLNNINLKKIDGDMKQSQSHKSVTPGTPSARRNTAVNKDTTEPNTNSTENIEKLQKIADNTVEPEFLKKTENSIKEKLQELYKEMFKTFYQKLPNKSYAERLFSLGKSIYYNLLEKIIRAEIRNKPNLDPKLLLQYEKFHTSLIACCLEVVIYTHGCQLKFPWILECFDLQAFDFYKIIESVVSNNENALTRSLIIHLNKIEEKCLDSLVWRSNSVLWEKIKELDGSFPLYIAVESKNINCLPGLKTVKKIDTSNLERNLLLSPMNTAYDSNKQSSSTESARRDLFNAGKANVQAQSIKQENNGERRVGRSIYLFCRKFYNIAFNRISELCKKLEMSDDENLDQIWTLFEYSVVNNTDLIRDRHLDQIIMCAIYVFIKVKEIKHKTFTDIMKFYRSQSQSDSHIYRAVLIEPPKINPTTGEESPATYDDIIYFYNQVYVKKVTPYALEFGDKFKSKKDLLLSPHPPEKMPSPKQLLMNHHLYIQPLEKTHIQSPNSITFEFCKSPAKDLEKINQLVRGTKRNLPFNDDENGPTTTDTNVLCRGKPYIPRKMQKIIREKHCDEQK